MSLSILGLSPSPSMEPSGDLLRHTNKLPPFASPKASATSLATSLPQPSLDSPAPSQPPTPDLPQMRTLPSVPSALPPPLPHRRPKLSGIADEPVSTHHRHGSVLTVAPQSSPTPSRPHPGPPSRTHPQTSFSDTPNSSARAPQTKGRGPCDCRLPYHSRMPNTSISTSTTTTPKR